MTATDVVLTVTELLRRHGVVGKFVEAFGPGVAALSLETRATIGNMSPEYGSTCTIFPIDEVTLDYLRFTGRTPSTSSSSRPTRAARGCGTTRPPASRCYSEIAELDLASVEPSLAGPSRPQDRVTLSGLKTAAREAIGHEPVEVPATGASEGSATATS